MKLFQKIQLFSSFVLYFSPLVVFFVTYIYCVKAKKNYLQLGLITALYMFCSALINKWIITAWLVYLASVPVTFLYNYFLVKLQAKCAAQALAASGIKRTEKEEK